MKAVELRERRRLFSSCGILAHTIHSKALEECLGIAKSELARIYNLFS